MNTRTSNTVVEEVTSPPLLPVPIPATMSEEVCAASCWWADQMIESMGRHNQRKRTAANTTATATTATGTRSRVRSGNRAVRRDRNSSSSSSGGDAWSMYTGSNSNSNSQGDDHHHHHHQEVSSSSEEEGEEFYEDEFYDYENGAQRLSMDQTVVGNRGGAGSGSGTVGGIVVVDVAAATGGGDAAAGGEAGAEDGESEAAVCTMQLPVFSQQFMDGFREQFSQSLRQLLVDRFTDHWYEDDPTRGSGYRAIISDQIQYDTLLLRSLEMCASWVERNMSSSQPPLLPTHWQSLFVRLLPRNVIMFCNPRRVCVRQLGGARYYQVLNVYLKRQPSSSSSSSSSTYSSPASPMQPLRTSTPIIVEPDNTTSSSSSGGGGAGDGTDPDGQHQRVKAIKA